MFGLRVKDGRYIQRTPLCCPFPPRNLKGSLIVFFITMKETSNVSNVAWGSPWYTFIEFVPVFLFLFYVKHWKIYFHQVKKMACPWQNKNWFQPKILILIFWLTLHTSPTRLLLSLWIQFYSQSVHTHSQTQDPYIKILTYITLFSNKTIRSHRQSSLYVFILNFYFWKVLKCTSRSRSRFFFFTRIM